MERPSHSSAPENQLLGSSTRTSGVQVEGPLKTTMSPGSGSPNQYGTLLTSTRSPVHPGHPCSVCSIDPEGMKKACTRKVFTSSANTNAISSRTGSSRSSEPFFFGCSRRWRRLRRAGRSSEEFSACSPVSISGVPSSPSGTTSAGPAGRSLLIAGQRTAGGGPPESSRGWPRRGGWGDGAAARDPPPPLLVLCGLAPPLAGDQRGGGGDPPESGRGWPGRGCWGNGASARDRLPLLLDLGGLAAQLAEVVQLRPADVTAGDDLDLLDDRGVHREGPLDADAEAHLAHGEGLPGATALPADHDALEDLDAGAVALDHADVHLDGVAGTERGDVVAQRIGVECVQGVHLSRPVVLAVARTRCGQWSSPAVRSGGLRLSSERASAGADVCSSSLLCHNFSRRCAAAPSRGR